MKKRYIKPTTTAVTICVQQMIANSGKAIGEGISKEQTPDTSDDIEPNRSREGFRSYWDDEEDF